MIGLILAAIISCNEAEHNIGYVSMRPYYSDIYLEEAIEIRASGLNYIEDLIIEDIENRSGVVKSSKTKEPIETEAYIPHIPDIDNNYRLIYSYGNKDNENNYAVSKSEKKSNDIEDDILAITPDKTIEKPYHSASKEVPLEKSNDPASEKVTSADLINKYRKKIGQISSRNVPRNSSPDISLYSSVIFSNDELEIISEVVNKYENIFGANINAATTGDKINNILSGQNSENREDTRFYLGSVIYSDRDKWSLWLNGEKISSTDKHPYLQGLKIDEVNNHYVRFLWANIDIDALSPKWTNIINISGESSLHSSDNKLSYDKENRELRFILSSNQNIDISTLKIAEGMPKKTSTDSQ